MRMMLKRRLPVTVIQICCTAPMSCMFASSKVSPAGIFTLGDTFQPWPPNQAATSFPVPSVAMPPLPFSPVKFSGDMERVFALDKRERFPSPMFKPLKVYIGYIPSLN
jgi:hypothetical protein